VVIDQNVLWGDVVNEDFRSVDGLDDDDGLDDVRLEGLDDGLGRKYIRAADVLVGDLEDELGLGRKYIGATDDFVDLGGLDDLGRRRKYIGSADDFVDLGGLDDLGCRRKYLVTTDDLVGALGGLDDFGRRRKYIGSANQFRRGYNFDGSGNGNDVTSSISGQFNLCLHCYWLHCSDLLSL